MKLLRSERRGPDRSAVRLEDTTLDARVRGGLIA